MAYCYILKSESGTFYTGSCQNLEQRLEQHRSGLFENSFTATIKEQWLLFLCIDNLSYEQARLIERHIKNMKSKRYIENLKRYPELVGKLKTRYTEGPGSSP